MGSLRAVALILVVFAATLIWRCPARWVAARLPAGIRCDAEGTIWSGTCTTFATAGIRLENLRWHVQASELLRARLAATVTIDDPRLAGSAQVRAERRDVLVLPTLDLRLSLQSHPLPALPPGVAGEVALHLTDLVWRGSALTDVHGTIVAQQVRRLEPPLDYGSYELRFADAHPADGGLAATLRDLGGPLAVNGVVHVGPRFAWTAQGTVATRPEADDELQKLLALLGPPDPMGRRAFSVEGSP